METYLNEINGVANAIIALHESHRHMTRKKELDIRCMVYENCNDTPACKGQFLTAANEDNNFINAFKNVLKYGREHITLLKFIDLSFTVYGMHRAGQDDIDSHAKRMDNRIVRESTRLADFGDGEMSDFYKGKILTSDQVFRILGIDIPMTVKVNGSNYVKAVNGYIREDVKDERDVKRGLYMESIPSNFIYSVNLAEFAHMYQMRNEFSSAHPEVKQCIESEADQLYEWTDCLVTSDYLLSVKN